MYNDTSIDNTRAALSLCEGEVDHISVQTSAPQRGAGIRELHLEFEKIENACPHLRLDFDPMRGMGEWGQFLTLDISGGLGPFFSD